MTLDQIVPVLQLSVAPVILISGVGLVLLSMTNRYGRVIDRSRILAEAVREADPGKDIGPQREQLTILGRRARLLRLAITLTTLSILLAALLVIALFLLALFGFKLAFILFLLFTACTLSLIAGLVVFLFDINVSLGALDLEVRDRTG